MFKGYKTKKMKIKGKTYNLWVADTDKKRSIGLSKIKKLPNRTGMLFTYKTDVNHGFTMRSTRIPLTIIFLDKFMKVIDVFSAPPFYKKLIKPNKNYRYVIEI
jgi:uncharacterized membrane protein (UPF0127 family)